MLSIELNPSTNERLTAAATKCGQSASDFARAAITEALDQWEDVAIAKYGPDALTLVPKENAMIKAVLENGQIRPSCPLPAEWSDGQQLLVEVPSAEVDPAEIAAWSREIEEAAQRIPDDDHARFLDALAEQKRIAKEGVRRQMGLDG